MISESKALRTAILQYEHGGHRLLYVRHLLRSELIGPAPVLLLTDEGASSWEFREHLKESADACQAEVRSIPRPATPDDFLTWGLSEIEGKALRLIVPDADQLLTPLLRSRRSRRRDLQLRYLVMRTPMGSRQEKLLTASKYVLAFLLRMRWRRSRGFFLTDSFGVIRRPAFAPILGPLADPNPALPSVPREAARRRLSLPADCFVYGVLGTVTERKHPELAVAALEYLPAESRLLLAGQLSPAVRRRLDNVDPQLRARIAVLDEQLSDEGLGCAVSACDAVLLLHDLDGPSGMLTNAAAAGVPVLVGESPWLRRVAERMGVGSRSRHEPKAIADALLTMRRYPPPVRVVPLPDEAQFSALLLAS